MVMLRGNRGQESTLDSRKVPCFFAVRIGAQSDRLIVLNREMERQTCSRSISGVGIESDEVMPPKDDMLTKGEVGIIRAWIDRGAKFDPPGAAQK